MKKTPPDEYLIIKKGLLGLCGLILLLIPEFIFALDHRGIKDKQASSAGMGKRAADITIKGKVLDPATGQGLSGVSVIIKGSVQGTTTGPDGSFTLSAPEKAILVFTYIGYDPIEVPVKGQTTISVKMQVVGKSLSDVIVVGYGTQRKALTTAAVSTINTKEIAQKPVVNLTNSLVGRASGLIITQGSGEPGFDGSNILIRGIGSIGRQTPLFIVDGVPRDFSRLDPNTIDNISVLKDAAAVAPYGVAGANGVILITTKQGKAGKPSFSYTGYVGQQNPTKVPRMVNGYEFALMRNETSANNYPILNPIYTADDIQKFKDGSDPDVHGNAQPLKEIIKNNRLISSHNISLSGGSEDIKYFASLGYTNQQGMWDPTYIKKYNGNLNITAKATKTTTVALSVNSFIEDQHFPGTGAGSILDQAMRQTPDFPVIYSNGKWGGYIGQSLWGEIYHSGYTTQKNSSLYTQVSIDQKLPIKGLSVKAVVSYDDGRDPLFGNLTFHKREWRTPIPFWTVQPNTNPYQYLPGTQGSSKPTFTETDGQNHTMTYQGLLNYSASFGKHEITALAVVEDRIVKYETFWSKRINYNLSLDELDYGGPSPTDVTVGGHSEGSKQIGYVYRLDYAYDKKYLLQAAGRYDGSYLFGPGHRFGFFPSFSAGWRISEENFFKDNITWVNSLKIRGSWGASGAFPAAPGGAVQTYQYLSAYQVGSNSAVLGGNATQSVYENLQGNPNITWEKSKKMDLGFEATLWNGVLGIEADYFHEKRSNMLLTPVAALPVEYGVGLGYVNAGIMTNQGFDMTLTTFKNFSNDLRLDIKGTFTFARNKLIQTFENASIKNNPQRSRTNKPLNTQFGYQAIGLYAASDFQDALPGVRPVLKAGVPTPNFGPVAPGDIKYADVSGPNGKPDGKVDQNDEVVIGHPNTPEIIYGLEPRLSYKGFDLDVLFQGSGSSNIQLNNYFAFPFKGSGSASELSFKDHWTPTHTNALYPRLSGTPTDNNSQSSSWWIRNDSYVRIKSAELGYSFPTKIIGHSVQVLRIYVAGQNLVNWLPRVKETIDPENSGSNLNYYQQRVVSVGLNATF